MIPSQIATFLSLGRYMDHKQSIMNSKQNQEYDIRPKGQYLLLIMETICMVLRYKLNDIAHQLYTLLWHL